MLAHAVREQGRRRSTIFARLWNLAKQQAILSHIHCHHVVARFCRRLICTRRPKRKPTISQRLFLHRKISGTLSRRPQTLPFAAGCWLLVVGCWLSPVLDILSVVGQSTCYKTRYLYAWCSLLFVVNSWITDGQTCHVSVSDEVARQFSDRQSSPKKPLPGTLSDHAAIENDDAARAEVYQLAQGIVSKTAHTDMGELTSRVFESSVANFGGPGSGQPSTVKQDFELVFQLEGMQNWVSAGNPCDFILLLGVMVASWFPPALLCCDHTTVPYRPCIICMHACCFCCSFFFCTGRPSSLPMKAWRPLREHCRSSKTLSLLFTRPT